MIADISNKAEFSCVYITLVTGNVMYFEDLKTIIEKKEIKLFWFAGNRFQVNLRVCFKTFSGFGSLETLIGFYVQCVNRYLTLIDTLC